MTDTKNNEKSQIFRQKSLDRISSAEDLDKYIKTTNPSLWLLLLSIIVFLVGVIAWSSIGKINVESTVGCCVSDGKIVCAITEDRYEYLCDDSFIEVEGKTYKINLVNGPLEATQDSDSTMLHNSSIDIGDWYYEVVGNCDLKDGTYKGKVVFEQVSPITFVIN